MSDDTKESITLAVSVLVLPFMFCLGVGLAAILLKLVARAVL